MCIYSMYIDPSRLRRKSEARTIAAKHRLNTQKYKTDEEKKKLSEARAMTIAYIAPVCVCVRERERERVCVCVCGSAAVHELEDFHELAKVRGMHVQHIYKANTIGIHSREGIHIRNTYISYAYMAYM